MINKEIKETSKDKGVKSSENLKSDWVAYTEKCDQTPQFFETLNALAEQLKIDIENEQTN